MARSIQIPALSGAVLEAQSSGIREISNLARDLPGSLRLEVGQPDFRTPDHISEAGKKAIDDGITYYTLTAAATLIFIRTKANPLIVVFAAGVLGYFGVV